MGTEDIGGKFVMVRVGEALGFNSKRGAPLM